MNWLTPILGAINKVIPDSDKAGEFRMRLHELATDLNKAGIDLNKVVAEGQMATNQIEARGNAFQRGWRPSVGYICAAGLAYPFIRGVLMPWVELGKVDVSYMIPILVGILGFGYMRHEERKKGKA